MKNCEMLVKTKDEIVTYTFLRRSRATPKLLSEDGLFGFPHGAHIRKKIRETSAISWRT
jgi:hypothetical protein